MALTLSSDFSARARIRYADYVALVHVYYSGVASYKFSTKSCVIDGAQYLGIIEDIDELTETWNVFGENNVAVSVPSITLQDYTTETGFGELYRFSDVLGQAGIVGSDIDIRVGYLDTALSTFTTIFDGTIENVTVDDKITLECRSNDIPDDNINGRQISYKLQTLGTTSVTNLLSLPKEAEGLYLPVVFGQHWNSPLVCYNVETYATVVDGIPQFDSSTYWCSNDIGYQPNDIINSGQSYIKTLYQANINDYSSLIYLFQEGQNTGESKAALDLADGDLQLDGYVPGYEIGYRGGRNFTKTVFTSGIITLPGVQLSYPTVSGSINTDYSWFANVPLRMFLAGTGSGYVYLSPNLVSSDGEANLYKIFDGDEDTYWSYTTSGNSARITISVDIPLYQNLRVDENFAVHKNRPIFIPEKQITGDEYNMLLMGRSSIRPTSTRTLNGYFWVSKVFEAFLGSTPPAYYPAFTTDFSNPSGYYNFIGTTFFGRNANIHSYVSGVDYGYNYLSDPFIKNRSSSGHLIDFANDQIGYDEENTGYQSFVGDAGNTLSTAPYWMGTYPFLQRKVLNKNLKGNLTVGFLYSGILTERLHNLYFESYESIPYDLGGHIYTHMSGITIDNSDVVMLSCDNTGPINGYMLKRPNEYLEMIYQSKISGGLTESNYNYNEWALSDDDWKEVYGTVRDKSGFTLIEETNASEFVKEYCKDELWTSYRDNLGKFRFVIIPKDPLTIVINSITIDYKDLTNFKTYYSPLSNLCSEIKSLKTDYVYANETYVNDTAWKIYPNGNYDFGYWKRSNSYTNNGFVKDVMDKKYTSYTDPSVVLYSGAWYTCQISHTSNSSYVTHSHSDPGYDDERYWIKCTSGLVPPNGSAWATSTKYYGYDAEAEVIASLHINQWCNLHRMVDIETDVLNYFQLEIGDIVDFTNFPGKWLGLDIQGWNGNTTTSGIVVNGQTVTHKGIVTSIKRGTNSIKASVMQLHKLDDILVTRVK